MAGLMYTVKVCTPIWEGNDYNYCCDQDRNEWYIVAYHSAPCLNSKWILSILKSCRSCCMVTNNLGIEPGYS